MVMEDAVPTSNSRFRVLSVEMAQTEETLGDT